jgi:hypothetical protein
MGMGIACGRGWYNLIDKLCEELDVYPDVVAAQVKEKFGGLRFYIGSVKEDHMDKVYDIIAKYEHLSIKTCELCGEKGSRKGDGWVRTMCTPCEKQRELSLKITSGSCKYQISKFVLPLQNFAGLSEIQIFDEDTKVIFKGEFSDFMKLVAPRLALEELEYE